MQANTTTDSITAPWMGHGDFLTKYTGDDGSHNHGDTGTASSLQPSINLNWIVKAVMLIPVNSIVENSLTSTSTANALSAAQGKVLNDKFSNLATVATSGSYNDLSNKPTIPSVINNLTSTSTANALSAAQGKILKDLIDGGVKFGFGYANQKSYSASSWSRPKILYDNFVTNDNSVFELVDNQKIKVKQSGYYIIILSRNTNLGTSEQDCYLEYAGTHRAFTSYNNSDTFIQAAYMYEDQVVRGDVNTSSTSFTIYHADLLVVKLGN